MVGPSPSPPARVLLALVVLVLPSRSRDRYQEEFRAELAELRALSQLFQAGTLLFGSVSLRKALRAIDVIEGLTVEKSRWCAIGRHHYLAVRDHNPEMRIGYYLECTRCGKTKDKIDDPPKPPGTIVLGGCGSL